jgi:hypothetical protein
MLEGVTAPVVKRANHLWSFFDKPLDQGDTGTCVGHGWKGWLATAPIIQSDIGKPPSPFDIYDAAIQVDEWPDNDHDTERQMGTSVRAGAKVLQARGFLKEYRWCYTVDAAANWIAGLDVTGRFVGGPLVVGVNWYSGMFSPDTNGFVHISGNIAGGHCFAILGWNEKLGYAHCLNSWGIGWGHNGRFYLPAEELERLLQEDGEACASAEVKLPR